jgi:hypothetical protein
MDLLATSDLHGIGTFVLPYNFGKDLLLTPGKELEHLWYYFGMDLLLTPDQELNTVILLWY